MEKEVSHVTEIGVALVAVSALIAIIWYTVFLGQTIKVDSAEQASRLVSDVEQGVLQDLIGQENDMPAATAYGILRTYGSLIPKVTCNFHTPIKVTNLVTDTPCVLEHMRGKVSLEVIRTDTDWYEITIHKLNCTWYYSTCNCASIPE